MSERVEEGCSAMLLGDTCRVVTIRYVDRAMPGDMVIAVEMGRMPRPLTGIPVADVIVYLDDRSQWRADRTSGFGRVIWVQECPRHGLASHVIEPSGALCCGGES